MPADEQVDPRGVRGFQHDVDASRVTFEDVAVGGQPRVHPRCAPRHIQAAGQHRLGAGAAVGHAFAHHAPHREQTFTHLVGGADRGLVRPHHIGDGHALPAADGNQFVAGGERVRHPRIRRRLPRIGPGGFVIGSGIGWRRDAFMVADQSVIRIAALDESAADRIPHLFVHSAAVRVERLEPHPVGVGGQAPPLVEHHVTAVIEADNARAVQRQAAGILACLTDMQQVIGIHGFGQMAFQSRHRGAVGAMPQSRQRQRAVQGHPHAMHAVEQTAFGQRGHEGVRGAHRPHRMRRARPHAD